MKLYDWQEDIVEQYDGSGIVKAPTGAGKSLVGVRLAEKIGGHVLVASHSTTILNQWRVDMQDIPNVHFDTFQTLHKKHYVKDVDLLIVDEVELSTSEKFINLYDMINFKNVIGLSATPNKKAEKMCGKIIIDVPESEATIAPYIVEFHGINLTHSEEFEYRKMSKQIQKLMERKDNVGLKPEEQRRLDSLIFGRRNVVYQADNRLPYAIDLIRRNLNNGRKIVVFTQRKKQADMLFVSIV